MAWPDQKDPRMVEVLCPLRGQYSREQRLESRKLRIGRWLVRRRPQVLSSQIILQLPSPVAESGRTDPQSMHSERVDRKDWTIR